MPPDRGQRSALLDVDGLLDQIHSVDIGPMFVLSCSDRVRKAEREPDAC
jgi:hypothetical protein